MTSAKAVPVVEMQAAYDPEMILRSNVGQATDDVLGEMNVGRATSVRPST